MFISFHTLNKKIGQIQTLLWSIMLTVYSLFSTSIYALISTSSHPALKKYEMLTIESCFCSWATFHYFEIVCLVHYNQEHKPYWKKSDYFNKGLKECQPVRHPIKKLMNKGKAFFCKHVLTLIPQVKIKRDGVQCVAGTKQLMGEFPSLHSSKGNWEVETRKRVPCASNSSINSILF